MACKHCHDEHHEHTHEHEHNHEHNHEHHEENNSNLEKYLLGVSIALTVIAFVTELLGAAPIITSIIAAFAIVLSGYEVFLEGVRSVINRKIDETTLMSVAVIAAFCLGEFVEGALVTVLFGIGELLEDFAVDKSRDRIMKLADIQPDKANVIINNKETAVRAEDVAVDTEIIIKPHERVPLDCVITEGSSALDASAITGESMPVEKTVGGELLSGMINGDSLIKAKVTKSYGDSTASRIIKLVEEASAVKSRSEKMISRFARIYTPIVMVLAVLIAFVPPFFLGNLSVWIYRGLVCLVASCPCAIVISVPLAYFSGIGVASKYGALIKGGKYLEVLAKADTIAFDKTGTLTEGKLKLDKIIPFKNYTSDAILAVAASVERHSTHPIAKAIVSAYDGNLLPMTDYSERSGEGVTALFKGKRVSCTSGRTPNGKSSGVYLSIEGKKIGELILSDKTRDEAADVLEGLRKLGVKREVLLTGDNEKHAKQTAKPLKLDEVYPSLLPSDKLSIAQELKENSSGVCFVGDGINDAPVLAAVDCGFAMGLGSDAAIASADAVLSSGNLKPLTHAFRIAKSTVMTAKANIAFSLTVKAAVIILAALGFAPIWLGVLADTGVCMLCVLNSVRLLTK